MARAGKERLKTKIVARRKHNHLFILHLLRIYPAIYIDYRRGSPNKIKTKKPKGKGLKALPFKFFLLPAALSSKALISDFHFLTRLKY